MRPMKRTWVIGLILVLLGVVVYLPAMRGEFICPVASS